jgi:hypothetical protein
MIAILLKWGEDFEGELFQKRRRAPMLDPVGLGMVAGLTILVKSKRFRAAVITHRLACFSLHSWLTQVRAEAFDTEWLNL